MERPASMSLSDAGGGAKQPAHLSVSVILLMFCVCILWLSMGPRGASLRHLQIDGVALFVRSGNEIGNRQNGQSSRRALRTILYDEAIVSYIDTFIIR